MNIIINDRTCKAETGDRLLDVARANHAHIGYFCGGNGICQTCYVKVLEGSELLSPISETEKAMLSDRLIEEGTRMACLTNFEKPGTVKILSTVEEVKKMYETNPLLLPEYSAKMGWDALIKFPETVALQIERTVQGKFDILQIARDIIGGIADAVQLAFTGFQQASSKDKTSDRTPTGIEVKPPAEHHQSSVLPGCCRNGNGQHEKSSAAHSHVHHNGVPA